MIRRWLEQRRRERASQQLGRLCAAQIAKQDTPHSLASRKGWQKRRAG